MAGRRDKHRQSGLAAQIHSIRDTVQRFDEATLAAAERIRDADKRLAEGSLARELGI
jgi:hypothetical protein